MLVLEINIVMSLLALTYSGIEWDNVCLDTFEIMLKSAGTVVEFVIVEPEYPGIVFVYVEYDKEIKLEKEIIRREAPNKHEDYAYLIRYTAVPERLVSPLFNIEVEGKVYKPFVSVLKCYGFHAQKPDDGHHAFGSSSWLLQRGFNQAALPVPTAEDIRTKYLPAAFNPLQHLLPCKCRDCCRGISTSSGFVSQQRSKLTKEQLCEQFVPHARDDFLRHVLSIPANGCVSTVPNIMTYMSNENRIKFIVKGLEARVSALEEQLAKRHNAADVE